MKEYLQSGAGRQRLYEEYVVRENSTYVIAADLGTYPNQVRRALLFHGIPLRDRGDAQKVALESGRHRHPTRGRVRSEGERAAIGRAVAEAWARVPEEERARRVGRARQRWLGMGPEERLALRGLAAEGVRRAARDGSRLELHLLHGVRAAGHEAWFRTAVEGVRVDLVLPAARLAVDVKGPASLLPIWGEGRLAGSFNADDVRAGTLVAAGWVVLRLRHLARSLTGQEKREALDAVLGAAGGDSTPRLLEVELGGES